MDISFLDEIESEGSVFYEKGVPADMFDILGNSGVNSIRLRLWNDPDAGYVSLERTKLMAKRIKLAGMHFLLDFHYSDYWADPQKQTKPKAWAELPFPELAVSVREFTKTVIQELKEQGTLPDMVQIGNEITPGMLWDEGRVSPEPFDTDGQWRNLTDLVKAGIDGVKAALDPEDQVEIMIHIDRGGDNASSRTFFDRFQQLGVQFDVIGQSFYPWWHGTLEQLEDNMSDLALRYGKDIVVVETAYPWTLSSERDLEFILKNEDQLHEGYPATVDGQAGYLKALLEVIRRTPNGHGRGVHYWEPCWIPSKEQWSVGHPNNWTNLTLFDFSGNKLGSLDVFKEQ